MTARRTHAMLLRSRLNRSMNQEGAVVVVATVFVFVFVVTGVALFFLLQSSSQSATLERRDVKAFNVAEAGVDAAMVQLRRNWPRASNESVVVDPGEFRGYFDVTQFPDPTHDQFIEVVTYDDTTSKDLSDDPRTYPAKRVSYDQNDNKLMWIDSEALVDNVRHRILVQVKRLSMPVQIPDMVLAANTAGSNSPNFDVNVDPAYTGPIPVDEETGIVGAKIAYTGKGDCSRDVNNGANIVKVASDDFDFSQYCPDALLGLLKQLAKGAQPGPGWDPAWDDSYFSDTDGGVAQVTAFIKNLNAGPGSVAYFETSQATIEIAGNSQMGTPEKPMILVVDARGATNPVIDWKGTSDFHGVVIVVGNALLRGTAAVKGCLLAEGGVEQKGTVDLYYNGDYIRKLNDMYTLSVVIVPNTWEEYTIAKATTTTAP